MKKQTIALILFITCDSFAACPLSICKQPTALFIIPQLQQYQKQMLFWVAVLALLLGTSKRDSF